MTLFDLNNLDSTAAASNTSKSSGSMPLAARMRPRNLDEFVGRNISSVKGKY
jgi:replication-associated recombination protein RarA